MNQNFASNFLFQGVFNKNVNLSTETAKTVFVFAQSGVMLRARNKFVEIVAVQSAS